MTLSPPKRGTNADESLFRLLGGVVIEDKREQLPLSFPDLTVERRALSAGDYSIVGYETRIAIERKSLQDLIGSLTVGRDRFERELVKLSAYERALILVEAPIEEIYAAMYRGNVRPVSIVGSLASIHARFNVATTCIGNRRNAESFARTWLLKSWKRMRERDLASQGAA